MAATPTHDLDGRVVSATRQTSRTARSDSSMPTRNSSMSTPSSASSVTELPVLDEPGAGRAEDDAGQDVAHDRRLLQAMHHRAADQRGQHDDRQTGQMLPPSIAWLS